MFVCVYKDTCQPLYSMFSKKAKQKNGTKYVEILTCFLTINAAGCYVLSLSEKCLKTY